jgi:hypothetical protein
LDVTTDLEFEAEMNNKEIRNEGTIASNWETKAYVRGTEVGAVASRRLEPSIWYI